MTLQLAENIMAGMKEINEIYLPYAELDIVEWDNEKETPVTTVRALRGEQIQIELNWHNESYQGSADIRKLIDEAQREVIMFLLF